MTFKNSFFPCLILCFLFLKADTSLAINNKKLADQLYEAVQFQDLEKLKQLLTTKGANANSMQNGRPLLGWAAQGGNLGIVQALIDAKADVNKADEGAVSGTLL